MWCRTCGATHPAGFAFCLSCGERVLGSRFWPRAPEPLRREAFSRGCPSCGASLTDAISLLVGEDDGADAAQIQDVVIRGSAPEAPGLEPTHECRECGRQFWRVRSRWQGWRLQVAWRAVATLRVVAALVAGRGGRARGDR